MFPVLDLDGGDPSRVASKLDQACREVGFLAVVNHDVPPAIVDAAWGDAGRFFALPESEKQLVGMPHPGYPFGYSGLSEEDLERSLAPRSQTRGDVKESFSIGPPGSWPADRKEREPAYLDTATQWPARPDTLQATWIEYYRAMEALCRRILRIAARALAVPEEYFDDPFARHMSAQRALFYPRTARRDLVTRAGAHTDFGGITVLYPQPGSSGLQIQQAGTWVDVPAEEGTFVVNIGDLMARWTNDRWVSTMHRVVDRLGVASESRQSMAFFYNPNHDARIECLPSCLRPGESPRYPPVLAGEHLMQKYRRSVDPPEPVEPRA